MSVWPMMMQGMAPVKTSDSDKAKQIIVPVTAFAIIPGVLTALMIWYLNHQDKAWYEMILPLLLMAACFPCFVTLMWGDVQTYLKSDPNDLTISPASAGTWVAVAMMTSMLILFVWRIVKAFGKGGDHVPKRKASE